MSLDKFFGNGASYSGDLLRQGFKMSQKDQELIESIQAQKMEAYYTRDKLAIRWFLRQHMATLVQNPQNLEEMRPVIINFVPKILKRLCQVYANPPVFKLSSEPEQLIYDEQFSHKLNAWRKEFHRRSKLFNTILVRPIWRESRKEWDYMILHRGNCQIEAEGDDYNELEMVKYLVEEDGRDYYIVWTKDEHYAIDVETEKRVLLGDMTGTNNYKQIPFIILRLERANDFWGDGLTDLVDTNEVLNGILSDLGYKRYMQFGIPFGKNLGKSSDIVVSPKSFILADETGDGRTSDFSFVTPDHKTDFDINISDWIKSQLGIAFGLPADSFNNTVTAESGFSKMVGSLELLANNEDDEAALRVFEYNLWALQKEVMRVDKASIKFTSDIVSIEFNGMEFPKTSDEIWKDREFEYKYNMSSPVDWLRESRPDLTQEQAEQILIENDRIKKTAVEVKPPSMISQVLTNNADL